MCQNAILEMMNVISEYSFSLSIQDKLSLEGIVVQRAECRPAASENYMRLKRLVFYNFKLIHDIFLGA